NQNPSIGLPNIISRYFNRIDIIIKKYFTSRMLKLQRYQISESLLYRVKEVKNWEYLVNSQVQNLNLKENSESDNHVNIKFHEDNYESTLLNLHLMMKYLDSVSIYEVAITICSSREASRNEIVYKHRVVTNFDILNEIQHTQPLSETIRQNLAYKTKYNQGFGYAKKAINLALQL
ncbi:2848_t:CDS:2, partial [Racocetra fulgida]